MNILYKVYDDSYSTFIVSYEDDNRVLLINDVVVPKYSIGFNSDTEVCNYFCTLGGVKKALEDKLRLARSIVVRLEHEIQSIQEKI